MSPKIRNKEIPETNTSSIWFSKRFFVAVSIFLCFSTTMILISNINIAVVEMTSSKIITVGNHTITKPPEFPWDPATVGIISTMTSYAGLFSFCGSLLANKLGGSKSCVIFLIAGGIATILTQVTLTLNFYLFLAGRFIIGISTNCFIVSASDVYSKWFPKKERSTLVSFCGSGLTIGIMLTNPVLGYVADRWGWYMVFYVSGITSIVFSILFSIIVKNQPSEDYWISKEELAYILEGTNSARTSQPKIRCSYKTILSSAPVLAVCFLDFTFIWVNKMLTTALPLYIKDITNQSTDQVGLISSIPQFAPVIVFPLSGVLMDYWKNHTDVTYTLMHKIIIGVGLTTASLLLFVTVLFSSFTVTMVNFILILVSLAFAAPIFGILSVNMAPNDSSTVSGLVTISTALSIIISRTITGFMTMNHTEQEWNNCFLVAGVLLILGAVVFLKYGSSEAQTWSLDSEEERRYLI